jgi:ERCC4-type nuclease
MITIDNRVGSKDLMKFMPKGKAKLGKLQFGDAAFLGNGPDEIPIPVGLEVKRLLDLLNSMVTGRLSGHQLPGMQASYKVRYLLVEGIWRPNPQSGLLEYPRGKQWLPVELGSRTFMAREVEGYLNTLDMLGGMHVRTTGSPRQTAQMLLNIHHWWTDKKWEEHRSHLAFDESSGLGTAQLTKPSLLRRVAKELTGIAWGRSRAVEAHFDSVVEMVNADQAEWEKIEGVAKKIAHQVVEELHKIRREK